jgi:hypothetical protein
MPRLPNIILILLAVFIGGGILSLSMPRLISAFELLPTAYISEDLTAGEKPSADDLLELHEAQLRALATHPSGQTYVDKGSVEIALAKSTTDLTKRRQWYEKAEQSFEEGLLLAPANPHAWSRLSFLRLRNGGDSRGAAKALSISYLTGSSEKWLAVSRLHYAMPLWGRLLPGDRELVKQQILWISKFNRKALIKLARKDRIYLSIVISALVKDMSQLTRFLKEYKKSSS